jgi:hypothetical protein
MSDKVEIRVAQSAIEPFWSKLPFLFRFPFRTGPLIFLACIVAASALAGLVLGPFGLLFRGILIYLGLRYAFNVLDLFAKGRFEGESVDHTLWGGSETRPAKLGLAIVLFIAVGATLGSWAVQSRLDSDPRAQDLVVASWQRTHAAEIAEWQREREAWEQERAEAARAEAAALRAAKEAAREAGEPDPEPLPEIEAEAEAPREFGPGRAEILREHRPRTFDALWWQLLPLWFWLVMGAASLWLPSAALVIAVDDAFFKSLNPVFVGHFVRAMGAAYFVLWFFVLAIVGMRQAVLAVGADWPTFLRLPVEMGLGTYLGLVLCALMGYVLYQFHQELHLDVEVDFDTHRKAGGAEAIAQAGSARAAVHSKLPDDPLERRVQPLLEAGNVKEAIAEVKDEMRYDRLDPVLNTRLHALYLRAGDRAVTLTHGQQWLTALTRAGQGTQALAALRKLRTIDADFAVQDGNALLPLALAAEHAGERDVAMGLINGFDKRHPGHKDLPGVLFLGARLLSEHARQHDKAAQLLRTLLAKHPQHELVAEIKTYLAVLERMQAAR